MSKSAARSTLQRANYFLAQARLYGADLAETAEFENNLAAAIAFGRAAMNALEKELRGRASFKTWFNTKSTPLQVFMTEVRIAILKHGRFELTRSLDVAVDAVLIGLESETANLRVTDHKPFHKRPLKTHWHNARRLLLRPYWRWRANLEGKRMAREHSAELHAAKEVAAANRPTATTRFPDPEYQSRSAIEWVAKFLAEVEMVITEAEGRFP